MLWVAERRGFDDCVECRQQDLPERDEICGVAFDLDFAITCQTTIFRLCAGDDYPPNLHATLLAEGQTLQ